MPSKSKKLLNGALLGAAVTALTVKGTLASPIGPAAQPGLDDLKNALSKTRDAAVEEAGSPMSLSAARKPGLTAATNGFTTGHIPPASAAVEKPHARGPARMRNILKAAALRHGVDAKLVLAVSYWESGWDQGKVSANGAIGLMQVEPYTAKAAGPALLGRQVDINDPYDNADVGVAVLREDLDNFSTPSMALAAYYQGSTSLEQNGMLPDTQQYVDGILSLASGMSP